MTPRPRPPPYQANTKSEAPPAPPERCSAIVARLTSFSMTTSGDSSSFRAVRRPRCQAGRFHEKPISPLTGSMTPGVPSTTRSIRDISTPASATASVTTRRTTETGSVEPSMSISARPTIVPVKSAQAPLAETGPTSTPTT